VVPWDNPQLIVIFACMYKIFIKPILFLFNPEKAHNLTFFLLKFFLASGFMKKLVSSMYCVESRDLERMVAGMKFPNPVGLGAGLDKDAKVTDEMACLGFGFIEIGTVTPKAQSGNDKPRAFRLPEDEALINRMGFNNHGARAAAEKLKQRKNHKIIIGGNIGKNKITSNEEAVNDYVICFNELFDAVDYFVVNVSSPNTPNLRELQDKEPLQNLLQTLQNENKKYPIQKPVFLKIAPDLTNEQLNDIVEIVISTNIAGVVATNTTITRDGLHTNIEEVKQMGMGGLSGKPLTKRSTEVIKYLRWKLDKKFAIIGVGGIHNAEDAIEKITAGADLIQIYTGFIYEGPKLIRDINRAIVDL
jgi:dihydroorotate dehydrogenase